MTVLKVNLIADIPPCEAADLTSKEKIAVCYHTLNGIKDVGYCIIMPGKERGSVEISCLITDIEFVQTRFEEKIFGYGISVDKIHSLRIYELENRPKLHEFENTRILLNKITSQAMTL